MPLSVQEIIDNAVKTSGTNEPARSELSVESNNAASRSNDRAGVVIAADRLNTPQRVPSFSQQNNTRTVQSRLNEIAAEARRVQSLVERRAQQERQQPQNDFRNQLQAGITDLLNRDTANERQQIREDLDLEDKGELSRDLFNDITETRRDFEDQIRALEANPEGKLRGALQAEINDLTEQANRILSEKSFQFSIVNGDFQAAQQLADQQIRDMEAADQRRLSIFQTAYNFVQNDLSESEKVQIQQEFQQQEAQRSFERQQQMAVFNYELGAAQRQFDNNLALRQQGLREAQFAQSQALANRQSQFGTLNGEPQTTTQATANGYADRTLEANRVISDLEGEFNSVFNRFGANLPNFLQTDERQSFEQAKRNFVNAVLRRESGAVISDQEFANAELQYFEQPGDSDETIRQKALNRNTVINNLYREANVLRPVEAGDVVESNGNLYLVGEDRDTLTPVN